MNITIVKSIVGLTASIGVGTVVENAVKAITPVDISKFGKVATVIGSIVLTGMVGIAAEKYTDGQIDKAVEFVHNLNNPA